MLPPGHPPRISLRSHSDCYCETTKDDPNSPTDSDEEAKVESRKLRKGAFATDLPTRQWAGALQSEPFFNFQLSAFPAA